MVAVHLVMFSSSGKAVIPGVGLVMMSMSSFWRLESRQFDVVLQQGVVGEDVPLGDGRVGAVSAAVGGESHGVWIRQDTRWGVCLLLF